MFKEGFRDTLDYVPRVDYHALSPRSDMISFPRALRSLVLISVSVWHDGGGQGEWKPERDLIFIIFVPGASGQDVSWRSRTCHDLTKSRKDYVHDLCTIHVS